MYNPQGPVLPPNQLDLEKVNQIIQWCDYFSIEPLFSIISDNAYKIFKKTNLKKIKIASRSLKYDLDLVAKIVKENKDKKIIIHKECGEKKKNLLHLRILNICTWKSISMSFNEDLKDFPKKFQNNYVGYSDHCIGIETCLLAISRGAKIIEKHFTLDKSDTTIRDHTLSATPPEFKQMVDIGNEIKRKIDFGI